MKIHDYQTNQTEIEIPSAYYYDNLKGTIVIVLPPEVSFRVVVDARYTEQPTETYGLRIIALDDFELANQTSTSYSIQEGTSQEYEMQITSGGEVNLTPKVSLPLWQQYGYVVVAILVAMTSIFLFKYTQRTHKKMN